MWWDSGTRPTAYTGTNGPHKDHVHVAFKNDHLDILPYAFDWMCKNLVTDYVSGHDGAADRQDGLYGQAFDPKRPGVRLSRQQRKEILLRNMGMEGA